MLDADSALEDVRKELAAEKARWQKVSKKSGVTVRTFYNIIEGKRIPHLSTLTKIQKAIKALNK